MYWNNSGKFTEEEVMNIFFYTVSGKRLVDIGNKTYYMPINYITDEKEVIVDENLPIINLKNNNLQVFSKSLKEYVEAYFSSEKYWANPIKACSNNREKLEHAIATLWLNATPEDYEHPIEFIQRYTEFVKDETFDEFSYEGKTLHDMQTLKNCNLRISREEQEEFQETPDAILLTIEIENPQGQTITKKLPRVAYGIANGTAYIYGIQGYHSSETDSKEMKKVNRSRYQLNNMENIPDDYHRRYLRQEPYAYMSLFTFLCMLKEKGINRVVMPAMLPLRYEGKEIGLAARLETIEENFENGTITSKERREKTGIIRDEINRHQKIQYTVTNKFLDYMSRLECDVPGIEICQTPDMNNVGTVVQIDKMNPAENLPIFLEIADRIARLMKSKEEVER